MAGAKTAWKSARSSVRPAPRRTLLPVPDHAGQVGGQEPHRQHRQGGEEDAQPRQEAAQQHRPLPARPDTSDAGPSWTADTARVAPRSGRRRHRPVALRARRPPRRQRPAGVEVQVHPAGRRLVLALVLAPQGVGAVRTVGRGGHAQEGELPDLHPRVEQDGQRRGVAQLQRQVAPEARVDVAGGGVDHQPQAPQGALPLQAPHHVVREGDLLPGVARGRTGPAGARRPRRPPP